MFFTEEMVGAGSRLRRLIAGLLSKLVGIWLPGNGERVGDTGDGGSGGEASIEKYIRNKS